MHDRRLLPSHIVLVRCWLEGHTVGDGTPAWRYVIEEVGEERRRYVFTSLDALLVFLQKWLITVTQS